MSAERNCFYMARNGYYSKVISKVNTIFKLVAPAQLIEDVRASAKGVR